MKLVSTKTWYGGLSAVLNLKKSDEETCCLFRGKIEKSSCNVKEVR